MKKIGIRGQGLAFVGLELMIGIFIVVMVYALMNDAMVNQILPAGLAASSNASYYNATMSKVEMGWAAFPWVFIFSGFIFLLLVALMQGR